MPSSLGELKATLVRWKRVRLPFYVLLLLCCVAPPARSQKENYLPPPALPVHPTEKNTPKLRCSSAVLMDAVSGQVLFELNADKKRPIASTTKVMTALLLAENSNDDDIIKVSVKASKTPESTLNLRKGEKISAHDMMRGILLRSANDGCVATAEHIAGSEEDFLAMMNERAEMVGAVNTNFMNPHGLHHPDHYSTARDLALITREALRNERFREAAKCKKCIIKRSINKKDVRLIHRSRFLGKFPGADGVKTGWTIPAGKCYVGSATQNGWQLIVVVLNSTDYVADTADLMRYGFRNFEVRTIGTLGEQQEVVAVRDGTPGKVPVGLDRDFHIVVPKDRNSELQKIVNKRTVAAPVAKGSTLGSLDIWIDGNRAATVPLVALQSVAVTPISKILPTGGTQILLFALPLMCVGIVTLWNGKRIRKKLATLTKGSRRRRRRVSPRMRVPNRRR